MRDELLRRLEVEAAGFGAELTTAFDAEGNFRAYQRVLLQKEKVALRQRRAESDAQHR